MRVFIAKQLSKASSIAFWGLFALVVFLIIMVPAASKCPRIALFLADLFSATSLRNIAYNGMCDQNNAWGSAVAYAIGIILVLGLFVPVVTNRLRTMGERYIDGKFNNYYWKNHALFIGYDELMIGTLKQACKDYKSVVVAVSDNVSQIREQLSRSFSDAMGNIEIVQCNQDDESHLERKARIMKASRIFIIGQPDNPTHDAHNLRTLAIIAKKWNDEEIIQKKKNPNYNMVPHLMVYLRNQSTISLLQRQGFFPKNLWNTIGFTLDEQKEKEAKVFVNQHCEYFNFYCDKAFRMLTTKPKEEGEGGGMSLIWHSKEKNISIPEMEERRVHLVVLGMTQMGTALVRELLKLAHPSGKGTKMLITMVDKNAHEEMHFFIGRTRELFKLCRYSYFDYDKPENDIPAKDLKNDFVDVEFEFIQSDVAHPRLTKDLLDWSKDDKQLLTLVICTNDSPQNMAVAMYLPPEMLCGKNAVPTWVYQEGDDSMGQLLDRDKYPNMHPFSFVDHVVASTANSPIYEWDRKVTNYYEEHYRTHDVATKWERKTQARRWSSLYSIKSIEIKLRAVGIMDLAQEIEEPQKLLIDCYEHNRWVVERLTMGSRPTDAKQHEEVVKELKQVLEGHSDWKPQNGTPGEKERSNAVCDIIDKQRTFFNKLKNGEGEHAEGIIIHDNIRSFDDLDDYTKYKDRIILDDYIESIRRNPKP
jgi:hypothetical protein